MTSLTTCGLSEDLCITQCTLLFPVRWFPSWHCWYFCCLLIVMKEWQWVRLKYNYNTSGAFWIIDSVLKIYALRPRCWLSDSRWTIKAIRLRFVNKHPILIWHELVVLFKPKSLTRIHEFCFQEWLFSSPWASFSLWWPRTCRPHLKLFH